MKLIIIGSTGLVGENLIKLISNSSLNIEKICFVSSDVSCGRVILFKGEEYIVKTFDEIELKDYNVACLTTSEDVAFSVVPVLLKYNYIIIDNSSAFRKTCDLTIPELNFKENKKIYVNPNCCVIQSVIPLFYINRNNKISKIIYNTYQSLSGGGRYMLDMNMTCCDVFVGDILDDNSTTEEQKLIYETKKILGEEIEVIANCVRVPIAFGHLVNVVIEVDSSYGSLKKVLICNTIYNENIEGIDIENTNEIYTFKLKRVSKNMFSFYTYANNLSRGSSYNTYSILKLLNQ